MGERHPLNLPADVRYHEKLHLFVWRPQGAINENAVNKIITLLGRKEATAIRPFNRFTDTLNAHAIELNFRYIFHVSLFRRLSYAGRPPVKSAILVSNETMTHYGKMHAVLTQGSPLHVRIFQDRTEAGKWLDVPIEFLNPE